MITIKEISDMVGVSPTTVSNVLHGNTKKVSKENIERITKILRETNYIPPLGLNVLRQGKSKIIGVVIHSSKYYENTILSNPFYGQLVGELEKKIREAGHYMMLYAAEEIEDIVKMAVGWNSDGLIAITFTEDNYRKLKSLIDRPIVAIDLIKTCNGIYHNVGLDDMYGGYLMTKYILDQGIRKIFILATKDEGVDHCRFLGYKQALEEFGVNFHKEWFIKLSDVSKKRIESMRYLLKYTGKDIALFFLADVFALEAINFFQREGVKIPDDISIAGFDDSVLNEYVTPRLTTIHQDIREKAIKTFEVLETLIKGDGVQSCDIKLPIYLKSGDTIKKVNN